MRVFASSLAVVDCAGALAKLHPGAFITKLIPRLKKEIFTGEPQPCMRQYVEANVVVDVCGPHCV